MFGHQRRDVRGKQAIPESVLVVARLHVTGLPPVRGFRWRLAEGRRVSAGWYFDYEAERLHTNPRRPGTGFGFAPGFLVSDDGSLRVVRWGELRAVHGLPPVE
jgi:hypothetical protein